MTSSTQVVAHRSPVSRVSWRSLQIASTRALDEIARGNPEPFFELYSRSDDATLANPYGPPARGFNEIEAGGRRAAANYRDGKALGFETFAKFATADLGYMLEIESLRNQSRRR